MERALRSLELDLKLMTALLPIVVLAAILGSVRTGNIDLTWIALAAVIVALQHLRNFCRGAMERLRQLSELV